MSQKRKQISVELKLDILKRFKSGEKAIDIAKHLNLASSAVRTICNRDADQITKLAKTATSLQSQQVKVRSPLNQRKVPLSKMIIQNKAISIFHDLQNDTPSTSSGSSEKFEARNGWFQRVKSRANLHNISLKGESASADKPAAEKFKLELQAIVKEGYSRKQVLNVDETGLYWKRLPKKTYISKAEKSAPGYKASKDRLTLLLGGNAEGDFKFKPFLIYQSENPRALKNVNRSDLPVHWRANKKAWMTATLFTDWIKNCAVPELKDYCCSQKIDFKMLLLMDNAPGHPIYSDDISENIKIVFMPPNTTSIIQPMDQGVISIFKSYYLRRTFSQLIEATDKADKLTIPQFWKDYNIKMAVENIGFAWKEVKVTCMNGSWGNTYMARVLA